MGIKLEMVIMYTMLACGIIIGGTMIIDDVDQNYNLSISEGKFAPIAASARNISAQATGATETIREKILPKEISIVSGVDIIFTGAFTTLSLIWQFFTLPSKLITITLSYFGVPAFIGVTIYVMLIMGLVFSIIYMILKFEPR